MEATLPTSRMIADQLILAASLKLVEPRGEELVTTFYTRFFEAYPELRAMFPLDPEEMSAQEKRLLGALVALAEHYHEPAKLMPALHTWGRLHVVRFGVNLGHFEMVRVVLLDTFGVFAGDACTAEVHGAWSRAYQWAAAHMVAHGVTVWEPSEL